jgi:hypothetical protein
MSKITDNELKKLFEMGKLDPNDVQTVFVVIGDSKSGAVMLHGNQQEIVLSIVNACVSSDALLGIVDTLTGFVQHLKEDSLVPSINSNIVGEA